MRQTLTALGTDGTTLAVRDENGAEIRRITGTELTRLVETLSRLEELVKVVQRRGIDFARFLERRENGQPLPHFRTVVDGEEHYFETIEQRDEHLRGLKLLAIEEAAVDPTVAVTPADAKLRDAHWQRLQKNQELHEVKELERLFEALDSFSLSIDDYYLTQEESVSGEKLATKYVLLNEGKHIEVAGVSQIMSTVHTMAKQGIEVKRFKGPRRNEQRRAVGNNP